MQVVLQPALTVKSGLMCYNKLVRLSNGQSQFFCPVISVHFQVTRSAYSHDRILRVSDISPAYINYTLANWPVKPAFARPLGWSLVEVRYAHVCMSN